MIIVTVDDCLFLADKLSHILVVTTIRDVDSWRYFATVSQSEIVVIRCNDNYAFKMGRERRKM